MSSLKIKKGDYSEQRNIEAWRKLNQDLFKEAKIKQYEFADRVRAGWRTTLSTMLGGVDRLSLKNLTELLRCHIQLEGIKSSARFQEWLDILRCCPGYNLDAEKEDRLREVAEQEFREKNIITMNAVTATVDRLYNEVRALSKRDFGLLEEALWDVKFQRLLKLIQTWREE